MNLIALGPVFSTQSALGDLAEVKDAAGFAGFADEVLHVPPRGSECRSYTETDLGALYLAVTVDVRLIPKAEVDRPVIGDANAGANHVRYLGKTGQSRGWLDACSRP